jgi:hypothetical protein
MMANKEGQGCAMVNIMQKCDYSALEGNDKDIESRGKKLE